MAWGWLQERLKIVEAGERSLRDWLGRGAKAKGTTIVALGCTRYSLYYILITSNYSKQLGTMAIVWFSLGSVVSCFQTNHNFGFLTFSVLLALTCNIIQHRHRCDFQTFFNSVSAKFCWQMDSEAKLRDNILGACCHPWVFLAGSFKKMGGHPSKKKKFLVGS